MKPTRTRRLASTAFGLALLVAVLPWGLRRWSNVVYAAKQVTELPAAQRRPAILGAWITEAERLRSVTAPRAPIDLVMVNGESQDLALFAGSELHFRDCRYFRGWEAWRRRERAEFFHDARAANVPPGPPPGPAVLVVEVDRDAAQPLRVVEAPR